MSPSVVQEIKPSPDLWQSDWSLHQDDSQREGRRGPAREEALEESTPLEDQPPEGCNSFRLWISSEALGEVWTAILGQRASQEYLMESWTRCLQLN
jgi:hypothetical protein